MFNLEKRTILLWLFRNLIFIIPATVLIIISFTVLTNIVAQITLTILSVIIIILALTVPPLAYKYHTYTYSELKIIITKGFIFRRNILIPVKQIQDLHLYEGPLMMLFKLKGVEISTAGSNYVLSGLNNQNAKKMIEDLEVYLNKRLGE